MSNVTHKGQKRDFTSKNQEKEYLYNELSSMCIGKRKNPRREWKIVEEDTDDDFSGYTLLHRPTKEIVKLCIYYTWGKEYPQAKIEWVCPYSDNPFLSFDYIVYGFMQPLDEKIYYFALNEEFTKVLKIYEYESPCGSGWCMSNYVGCKTLELDNGMSTLFFSKPLHLKMYQVGDYTEQYFLGGKLVLEADNLSEDNYYPHWRIQEQTSTGLWLQI